MYAIRATALGLGRHERCADTQRVLLWPLRVDARFAESDLSVKERFALAETSADARFDQLEAGVEARFTRSESGISARFIALDKMYDEMHGVRAELTEVKIAIARLERLEGPRERLIMPR